VSSRTGNHRDQTVTGVSRERDVTQLSSALSCFRLTYSAGSRAGVHIAVSGSVRVRWGLAALCFGILAGTAHSMAVPLMQVAVASRNSAFTVVLQNIVNASKIIELSTFIFTAYQFWMNRRERKAADVAAAERAKIDTNYQAWQVINSAQGKGGSGGRIEALADLLKNGVSLAGIRLDDAWLEDVQLPHANLFHASMQRANLTRANLAGANLEGADLTGAILIAANLSGANLRGAILTDARLSAATLDRADLREIVGWEKLRAISHASVDDIRNAPQGFEAFALGQGAVNARTRAAMEAEFSPYSREFRAI
jgi:hypothetical protein